MVKDIHHVTIIIILVNLSTLSTFSPPVGGGGARLAAGDLRLVRFTLLLCL